MIGGKKKLNKKGQITIFIIIAVLIIALGVLIYMFYPKLISRAETETKNPSAFIQECMEEKIQDTVDIISLQGGDYVVNVDNGIFYKENEEERGTYVRYICYTNEDLVHCFNQESFLTEHVESEILNVISPDAENCFNSLVKSYENRGYEVNLKEGNPKVIVQILPNAILTSFNKTLTLVKGDESERYNDFSININSNLYDMLDVAKNIILWEVKTGDSIPEIYYDPSLKVEKHRKENDVKVYVLTYDKREVFRFAVRSFAAPVGF
ncbi:MAG: hypothetical protein AABY32_04455 [Nanoarchaeota archaeon]